MVANGRRRQQWKEIDTGRALFILTKGKHIGINNLFGYFLQYNATSDDITELAVETKNRLTNESLQQINKLM